MGAADSRITAPLISATSTSRTHPLPWLCTLVTMTHQQENSRRAMTSDDLSIWLQTLPDADLAPV
jgi:hypothetical protein